MHRSVYSVYGHWKSPINNLNRFGRADQKQFSPTTNKVPCVFENTFGSINNYLYFTFLIENMMMLCMIHDTNDNIENFNVQFTHNMVEEQNQLF